MEKSGAHFESPQNPPLENGGTTNEEAPSVEKNPETVSSDEDLAAELKAAVGEEGQYSPDGGFKQDPNNILMGKSIEGIFSVREIFDDNERISWIERYGNGMREILDSDRAFLEAFSQNPRPHIDELEERLKSKLH